MVNIRESSLKDVIPNLYAFHSPEHKLFCELMKSYLLNHKNVNYNKFF